jgi:hypothetical protein
VSLRAVLGCCVRGLERVATEQVDLAGDGLHVQWVAARTRPAQVVELVTFRDLATKYQEHPDVHILTADLAAEPSAAVPIAVRRVRTQPAAGERARVDVRPRARGYTGVSPLGLDGQRDEDWRGCHGERRDDHGHATHDTGSAPVSTIGASTRRSAPGSATLGAMTNPSETLEQTTARLRDAVASGDLDLPTASVELQAAAAGAGQPLSDDEATATLTVADSGDSGDGAPTQSNEW